jgi:glycosyltransferase involved in cell wall biosynthesis
MSTEFTSFSCPADMPRFLTVLPVFNEVQHVTSVLDQVVRYATEVLVVDDGSTDGSTEILAQRDDINLLIHPTNRGYGAALQTAFDYAIVQRYDVVVTIDCDGQHEPQRIEKLAAGCRHADIVSGSRYLQQQQSIDQVPAERLHINRQITAELNDLLGHQLTDAFCGFKAYRTHSLAQMNLSENGYAMPLELWVQAALHKLQVTEIPVPLIYLDEERSFGGSLDAAEIRLKYYREVIHRAIEACQEQTFLKASEQLCESQLCPCL